MTDIKINTAEKIETIVSCYRHCGTTEGTLGSLVDVPPNSNADGSNYSSPFYRVETDGKTFIVRNTAIGWSVQFGPYIGEDQELYLAAKLVTDLSPGGVASNLANVLPTKTED